MIDISISIEVAFGLVFIAIFYDIAYHIKIINEEIKLLGKELDKTNQNINLFIEYILKGGKK
ncbi:MAG: hypothetical protein QXV17_07240 [Candidatus Micrarchaeaceae archaeon]